jgi:galactose oxidase
MYDTGKILSAGDAPLYDNNSGVTTANVITVPAVGQTASSSRTQDMKYPCMFANGVVLPDGSVLVTGGQKFAGASMISSRFYTRNSGAPTPARGKS